MGGGEKFFRIFLYSLYQVFLGITCSGILSRFSWLAVHALAQAAESCASPVRLGISKPLGASSVIADYQTNPRGYNHSNYPSMSNRMTERQGQLMARQLHVRAATRTDPSSRSRKG